jgi:Luciferase-like monooxygenase
MKYGFVLPWGNARVTAELAREAEAVGWDGFFVWEPVWGVDAWVSLTAAAMVTTTIRLGTMLSPLSRMRPWKLASESATLDNLSNGRVILAVGLGAIDSGFAAFGEVTDRRVRAELLDEGLEILTGLWRGQPFAFSGKHYTVAPVTEIVAETPVQTPRIPIWAVGAMNSEKSLRRVAKFDGLIPNVRDPVGPTRAATPAELKLLVAQVNALRTLTTPFDVVVEGETPGDDPVACAGILAPWIEAGATWWLEAKWSAAGQGGHEAVVARLKQGPPSAVRD